MPEKSKNYATVKEYHQVLSDFPLELEDGQPVHKEVDAFLDDHFLKKVNKGHSLIRPERSLQEISRARDPLPEETFLDSLGDADRLAHAYFSHWYGDYEIETKNGKPKSIESLREQFNQFSIDYGNVPKIAQSLVDYEGENRVCFPDDVHVSVPKENVRAKEFEDSLIHDNLVKGFVKGYGEAEHPTWAPESRKENDEVLKAFLDPEISKSVPWLEESAKDHLVRNYRARGNPESGHLDYIAKSLVEVVREDLPQLYHKDPLKGWKRKSEIQKSASDGVDAKITFWQKNPPGILLACDQLPMDTTAKSVQPFLKNPGAKSAFVTAQNLRYEENGEGHNIDKLWEKLDSEKKSKDHKWHCRLRFAGDKVEVSQVQQVRIKQTAMERGGRE